MTVQNLKDYFELCWRWGRFYEILMTTEDPTQHSRDTVYQFLWDALPVPKLNEGLGTLRFHVERPNAHGWTVFEGIADDYKYERGVTKDTKGNEEDAKSRIHHIGALLEFLGEFLHREYKEREFSPLEPNCQPRKRQV